MTTMDPTTGEVYASPLDKLAAALAKAQAKIEGASKNKDNPHFGSKYADLASVWEAIREPLSENGLAVVQCPMETDGATVKLRTVLLHASGQWVDSVFVARPVKTDPQGVMSALTYLRRGALMAIVGVAPEDDDGNDASTPPKGPAPRRSAPPAVPTPPAQAAHPTPGAIPALATEATKAQIREAHGVLGLPTDDKALVKALNAHLGRLITRDQPLTEAEARAYLTHLRTRVLGSEEAGGAVEEAGR